MIKFILVTSTFLLTQYVFAETSLPLSEHSITPAEIDMTQANKAHASIKKQAKKDQSFWSKDQTKQAELEKKYKTEITKKPDNKKNYAYLAGLYLTNNKTTKAIQAYQDAITHDAENPKLFAALSIAYLHHAKYDMASAMATEAMRLDPELSGVKKINEYVVAKKEAIEAATKVPAGGSKFDISGKAPHGGIMPASVKVVPSDEMHKSN